MVHRWVASAAVFAVLGVVVAGCSSDAAVPQTTRRNWTKAGLQQTRDLAASIGKALPGQCADATPNDFSQFPVSMKQFKSDVVPTGQVLCDVNGELVEISVFANSRERDRYLEDRSTGICTQAKRVAKKANQPLLFAGLRWVVGDGNVTVQPDSESLARKLSTVTNGTYVPRQCATGITIDWDRDATAAMGDIHRKIIVGGKPCGPLEMVGRETLQKTRRLTNDQLPVALGSCVVAGSPIEIITYSQRNQAVDTFIADRARQACSGDSALGRIDGALFTMLVPGTVAEDLVQSVAGTLAQTTCDPTANTTSSTSAP